LNRPLSIVFALQLVHRTIDLDDESSLRAAEVCDEWADWMLPPKLQSTETSVTYRHP